MGGGTVECIILNRERTGYAKMTSGNKAGTRKKPAPNVVGVSSDTANTTITTAGFTIRNHNKF